MAIEALSGGGLYSYSWDLDSAWPFFSVAYILRGSTIHSHYTLTSVMLLRLCRGLMNDCNVVGHELEVRTIDHLPLNWPQLGDSWHIRMGVAA